MELFAENYSYSYIKNVFFCFFRIKNVMISKRMVTKYHGQLLSGQVRLVAIGRRLMVTKRCSWRPIGVANGG